MGLAGLALLAAVMVQPAPASAVPTLQVYIEGAVCDDEAETWKITSPSNKPLRLWAGGNVDGPRGKGPIFDVKAAFAYSSGVGNVTIDIASSTTNGFGGFTDPSTPDAATYIATHTDGSRPVRADDKKLAKHGVYGRGTTWQEWSFGDFTETDSPIADFVDAFPQAPLKASGQINAYDVSVSGLNESEWVNIDIYGYILNKKGYVKSRFAPFSHNAAFELASFNPTSGAAVPAPGAGLIFAAGFGFMMYQRRNKKRA
tara:strand:+ start:411 stop:1181 length:771 start_codon:yes stop_codon:yes gene_type:complete